MNRKIVVAGIVILGFGFASSLYNKRPMTPVLIGGYVFLVALGIADMFGPPLSDIAGGMAMVAVLSILLLEGPDLFKALQQATKASAKGGITGGTTAPGIYPVQPGQTHGDISIVPPGTITRTV